MARLFFSPWRGNFFEKGWGGGRILLKWRPRTYSPRISSETFRSINPYHPCCAHIARFGENVRGGTRHGINSASYEGWGNKRPLYADQSCLKLPTARSHAGNTRTFPRFPTCSIDFLVKRIPRGQGAPFPPPPPVRGFLFLEKIHFVSERNYSKRNISCCYGLYALITGLIIVCNFEDSKWTIIKSVEASLHFKTVFRDIVKKRIIFNQLPWNWSKSYWNSERFESL